MTAIVLPNTGLSAGYLNEESGWGTAMNANLRTLDALVQARALDKDLTAPPATPTSGALYIVAAAATGAWAGQSGKLAIWTTGDDVTAAWQFVSPKSGWLVFVVDESTYYRFDGSAWVSGIVTIPQVKQALVIDLTDVPLAVGTSFATYHVPFAFTLKKVLVGLDTAQTTGPLLTFNVRKNAGTLFSTKLSVDNNERTSATATTAAVLVVADTPLVEGDEITVDVDQIGVGGPAGAKVYLVGVAG